MISEATLREAWEKALGFWGLSIQVDLPTLDRDTEALAFIDLTTRRVVVNPVFLAKIKAEGSLEAILTHELGHHLRYPHSLAVQARLQLFEKEILPLAPYSLLNLFTDYLINTDIGGADARLRKQLEATYLGMPSNADAMTSDPAFYFYLTCFEEAWGLDPHTLSREAGEALEKRFPGCRAQAQLLAQEIPNLAPNLFTQFLYFASVLSRFQMRDADDSTKTTQGNPMKGDHSDPSPGDYADALSRSAQESEAIRKAIEEGWLDPKEIPDAATSEQRRVAGLPGVLAGKPKVLAEAMALHYRRLAERYLLKPPKERKAGEPIIPTTLSPWEIGDSPKEIDWLSSIVASGADLAVAAPLKRDLDDDEPSESEQKVSPRLEIYLDVSGSMPDPKTSVNAMTLAAQVLAMSALRNGGLVRGLIYSTNNVKHWEFTRSEMEMSRFLMNYIGGGTSFPFDVLKKSVVDCGRQQPIRIVLTDADFSYNLKEKKEHPVITKTASEKSPFIALLNYAAADAPWVKEIGQAGLRTIPVPDMASFPKTAAALGESLFGKKGRG